MVTAMVQLHYSMACVTSLPSLRFCKTKKLLCSLVLGALILVGGPLAQRASSDTAPHTSPDFVLDELRRNEARACRFMTIGPVWRFQLELLGSKLSHDLHGKKPKVSYSDGNRLPAATGWEKRVVVKSRRE